MRGKLSWIASLMMGSAFYISSPLAAAPMAFTWDPAAAAPALAGSGSAFTADTILTTNFLRDVAQPDGTGAAHEIGVVTGFSLRGSPVSPVGFGSSYGLYLDIADTHISGPPPEILHFTSLNISLKADPGNQNGAALATFGGVGFANTGSTGQADDITLATGSMVTALSNLDLATGVLTVDELGTFRPAPGQTGFFSAPSLDGSVFLHAHFSNPALLVSSPPQPDGTTITTFNDFTGTAQLVPEPASVAILGIALLGFLMVPMRR